MSDWKNAASDDEDVDKQVEQWGEDLMGDDADRAYLNSLSNLERETILAERFGMRKEYQERRKAKARLSRSAKSRASGAGAAGGSSKPETKADKLTAKKRELEKKYEEEEEEEDDEDEPGQVAAAPKRSSSSAKSTASKVKTEEADKMDGEEQLRKGEPAPFDEHLLQIQLQRRNVVRFSNEPYFVETVKGVLARVSTGYGPDGSPVYMCVEVREVIKRKTAVMVDKRELWYDFLMGYGDSTRTFKGFQISNSPLTPKEYAKFLEAQKKAELPLITAAYVKHKIAKLAEVANHTYTDDQVQEVVDRRYANLRKQPINVLRQKRLDISGRLNVLRDNRVDLNENVEEENELKAQLQELDDIIKEKAEKVEKVAEVKGVSFNKRIRDKMYETEQNGEEYYGHVDDSDVKEPNPFVRRKTIQHTMHFGEEAERLAREEAEKRRKIEEQERAAKEEQARREHTVKSSQLLSDIHSLKRKKTLVVEENAILQGLESTQQRVAQAHNFELDIDI